MTTPVESPRYFAFISYSHRDEAWAQWLHKALETYRVPSRLVGQATAAGTIPRRLLPIFRDRDELASSSDLGRTVNAALAQSQNLIVICSPASAQSRWVNEEVLSFKRVHGGEHIFCVIVDGEPDASYMPGREAEECFAPALRYTLGADGQPTAQRTEPIAADAREGKDGKANAKLKLVAGLLGVGFDALKQREQQRRNRRMAIVTAAALVIMAITTTLAITAVIARHDAERRQKQAEDLVGFMLGDLNDKLREVGRLDILQVVDDKAMDYFASLSTKDVTDAALAKRVEALQKIGGVREDQGQMPAALDSYRAASTLAAELLERNPSDAMRQADYANSLSWIGKAYWYQGDLTQAAKQFEAASDILGKLAAAKPDDTEVAFRLSSALTNAGRVLEARGEFSAAKPYYESVKKIFEDLQKKEPRKNMWRSSLGDAHNNLGKLALEQGQLDQAIMAYRADQRIKAELFAQDRANREQQEYLAVSNAILGRTLLISGETDLARRYLTDAVAGLKAMLEVDSTQTSWQFLLARYSEQLGGALRQLKEFNAAAEADSGSLRLLASLSVKDPTNTEWQQELVRSRIESARLQLDQHAADEANKLLEAARAVVEQMTAKNSGDRNVTLLAVQADIVAGQIAAARNERPRSREYWKRACDMIAPFAKSGADITFLADWATTLLLLDDTEGARPVVVKLAALGYRTPDFTALVEKSGIDYPVNTEISQRIANSLN